MKKQLQSLLLVIFLSLALQTTAQTLVPGDIVVIGMGADTGNPAPNVRTEFSWVPLINLSAGTQFYFTDAGWNTLSNEFMGTGLTDEILLRFTVPSGGILAGTVQIVSENGTDANYTVISGTKCGSDTDGKLSIPNAGDEVIVFRSTATVDANFPGTNFTAIFAVTNSTTDFNALNTTTAATATAFKDNYTNLPPGLTAGTNAVAVGIGAGVSDEADNVRFEGSTTGSRAVLLARVCTLSQWKRYDIGSPDGGADFNGSSPVLGWTNFSGANFNVAGADITPPVVQSIALSAAATNSASVTYTITFNESVNNVSADDFSLATTGGVTGTINTPSSSTGTSMTVVVNNISGAGTLKLNLNSNTNITDATGNGNNTNGYVAAYTSGGVQTVDRVAPTVSISSGASNPTNLNPISVTFTFSEAVTGFDASDVSVSGGSISSLSANGNQYTGNITPSADGTITVNVGANVANDGASNGNTAASQFSIISDRTQPTVSLSSGIANPTNSNSFSLQINFSESVSNFAQGDISVGNATLSAFSGSGSSYSVTVTPSADGTVTANVSAGVANDAAGNTNAAAIQFSRTVDRSQPSVSITSSIIPSTTNSNPIPVTITFSEAVSNFIAGDITVGNGTVTGFTVNSSTVYSFNLVPSANGTVTVNVSSNVANDVAGNGNSAASQFSKTFDSTQPSVVMTSGTTSPTNSTSIPVTVTFSESVTGFIQGDIIAGNATISGFSGSGASYSFNLIPSAAGTITANIVGGIATDAAGNGNTAATQFSIVYDNSQPSVIINSVTASPTNSASIPVTFTFSESVTGFSTGDISVGNGSLSNFSGSGSNYSVTVTPSGAGTVTVNVGSNGAIDSAGNGNTAASQFSIVYDNTQPSVSISSVVGNPTNASSFTVNFNFSESVNNFISSDISVGNGSLSNFNGSGSSYSATVTATSSGTVTVNVTAGVANDVAGNGNTAAAQFSRTYDSAAPSLLITTTASNPTNANTIPLTFTFSEDVTGFDTSDITALGGTISNFSTTSNSVYTATLTPTADGTITLFIFQNSAFDTAGNGNTFSTFNIVSDKTKPTVSITSTSTTPTSDNPIPISFTFSESTSDFVVGDITVTGGTLTNFAGSGANYTVSLVPSGNGSKTVRLLANVMSDAAGNTNNASAVFSVFYLTPCSQTTTWNGLFWTNGDPIPTQPAVIAADYTSDNNPGGFSACSLLIGNNAQVSINVGDNINITGNLSIQTGSVLTAQSGSSVSVGGTIITPNADAFVFESGANLIQSGASNNNTGSITYKRDTSMRRLDYTYWSSPVAGQNLKVFSPLTVSPPVGATRFYSFDEPTNAYVALDPVATTFAPAKGYMIRAENNLPTTVTPWTGIFKGIPNNGNYSISVTADNTGFNMIGNPYASTIDADLFLASNPGTIYFWTHIATGDTNSSSNYATYSTLGGVAAVQGGPQPNGTIQAGQGFLLQKVTSGTASFTNSMRVNNTESQFYRNQETSSKSRIWLNLSNETTALNQMLVGYMDGATLLEDESMDGKMIGNGSSLSSVINNANYVIQARPLPFSDSDIVALNFTATASGNYTISLESLDGLFADQNVYLRDLQMNVVHDIKQSAYNFASLEGSFVNRFEIIYQNTTLGIENPTLNANQIVVYKEGQNLKINAGTTVMESFKIFDIRGRLIHQSNAVNSSTATVQQLEASGQVLLLQITSVDKNTVTKKIVY